MGNEVSPWSVDISLLPSFQHRTLAQQQCIKEMMAGYIANHQVIQAGKLIDHALVYVDEGKVQEVSRTNDVVTYHVAGQHDPHVTTYSTHEHSFGCDCALFNGTGKYEGQAGECSHVQAIRITQIEEQNFSL